MELEAGDRKLKMWNHARKKRDCGVCRLPGGSGHSKIGLHHGNMHVLCPNGELFVRQSSFCKALGSRGVTAPQFCRKLLTTLGSSDVLADRGLYDTWYSPTTGCRRCSSMIVVGKERPPRKVSRQLYKAAVGNLQDFPPPSVSNCIQRYVFYVWISPVRKCPPVCCRRNTESRVVTNTAVLEESKLPACARTLD